VICAIGVLEAAADHGFIGPVKGNPRRRLLTVELRAHKAEQDVIPLFRRSFLKRHAERRCGISGRSDCATDTP
jgi:hypothetical protein